MMIFLVVEAGRPRSLSAAEKVQGPTMYSASHLVAVQSSETTLSLVDIAELLRRDPASKPLGPRPFPTSAPITNT